MFLIMKVIWTCPPVLDLADQIKSFQFYLEEVMTSNKSVVKFIVNNSKRSLIIISIQSFTILQH